LITNKEESLMTHFAFTAGSVAVVTGGAAGIGFAAAKRFAQLGLRVCIADLGADRLARAAQEVAILKYRVFVAFMLSFSRCRLEACAVCVTRCENR